MVKMLLQQLYLYPKLSSAHKSFKYVSLDKDLDLSVFMRLFRVTENSGEVR